MKNKAIVEVETENTALDEKKTYFNYFIPLNTVWL